MTRPLPRWLEWFPLLVAGLALLSLAFERLLPFTAAAALLLCLVFWILRRGSPLPLPFTAGLLFLLALLPLTLWVTPLPAVTLLQVLRLLAGLGLCGCLAAGLLGKRAIGWALAALLALSLALAGLAVFFTAFSDKFRFLPALSTLLPPLPTGLDTLINPNVAGGILALLLAGLLAWLVFRFPSLGWPARLGLGLAGAVLGAVLLLSQSRSALLSLLAALGLLALLRWRRGWVLVILGLAAGLALFFYLGPQQVWYSLGGETGGVATFAGREHIWLRARLMIADFPLTGVGMGAFGAVVDALYPLSPQPLHIPHAHNLFLQIAADLGLPGLLAWLVCFASVLWMAWRLYRSQDPFYRALGAAVLCSQAALWVNGLLDCVTWDTRPAVLVWAIWGLTAAAWNVSSRPRDPIQIQPPLASLDS